MTLKDCFWCCYLLHVYRDIKLAHLPGMYEQISSKSDVQFRWNLQGYWRMSLGQISSLWLLHPMGIGPIRSRRMLVVVECLACFWSCVLHAFQSRMPNDSYTNSSSYPRQNNFTRRVTTMHFNLTFYLWLWF